MLTLRNAHRNARSVAVFRGRPGATGRAGRPVRPGGRRGRAGGAADVPMLWTPRGLRTPKRYRQSSPELA
ncbi:hypothetical protein STRTUCAR8_04323 [Streptomyces turgidiscabies Car8]|uniref:Uncharacterized protein n=1 Tax=Streptomyces turgidiscabies (strain Car8) TaxID=698760 RepID=L7F628_STRT8|nr:hypothetical protein STRTUCAR8_04323 [Streptomyces turgidiscabies Car8]